MNSILIQSSCSPTVNCVPGKDLMIMNHDEIKYAIPILAIWKHSLFRLQFTIYDTFVEQLSFMLLITCCMLSA